MVPARAFRDLRHAAGDELLAGLCRVISDGLESLGWRAGLVWAGLLWILREAVRRRTDRLQRRSPGTDYRMFHYTKTAGSCAGLSAARRALP